MFTNGELTSRASHELRTPLNAILGFGELLELEELSDEQRHSVTQILAGGRHLLALIDDLLDLSRIQAGNVDLSLEPVEVGAAVADAVALCGPLAAERSLTVSVDLGDEPLWALADPRRLRQVLLNLISNGIKYNRISGSITLRVRRDGASQVRLDVADTGIGMTADQIGRLFEPFERLGAHGSGIEGTGLGLAVCKALTESMGGRIEVYSIPGSGSTFSVRLRAAHPATGAKATAKAGSRDSAGRAILAAVA
jgi:signal transduction histidine kinase